MIFATFAIGGNWFQIQQGGFHLPRAESSVPTLMTSICASIGGTVGHLTGPQLIQRSASHFRISGCLARQSQRTFVAVGSRIRAARQRNSTLDFFPVAVRLLKKGR